MLTALFHLRRRTLVVAVVLGLTVAATERRAESYGDALQVALPLLAWGCEAANGRAGEFFLRFLVMFTAAHGSKNLLGDAPINIRPTGNDEGMPSAHASAAVLGASALVHDCLRGNPVVQGAVIVSAAFVGSSRIEAEKHDIWQVLAGALLGLVCDRALRGPSAARRRVAALLARGAALGRAWGGELGRAGAWCLARADTGLLRLRQGLRASASSAIRRPEPMLTPSTRPTGSGARPRARAASSKAARSASATKASAQGASAIAAAAPVPSRSRMSREVRKTTDGSA